MSRAPGGRAGTNFFRACAAGSAARARSRAEGGGAREPRPAPCAAACWSAPGSRPPVLRLRSINSRLQLPLGAHTLTRERRKVSLKVSAAAAAPSQPPAEVRTRRGPGARWGILQGGVAEGGGLGRLGSESEEGAGHIPGEGMPLAPSFQRLQPPWTLQRSRPRARCAASFGVPLASLAAPRPAPSGPAPRARVRTHSPARLTPRSGLADLPGCTHLPGP